MKFNLSSFLIVIPFLLTGSFANGQSFPSIEDSYIDPPARPHLPDLPFPDGPFPQPPDGAGNTPNTICFSIHDPSGKTFMGRGYKWTARTRALAACEDWKIANDDRIGTCKILDCDVLIEEW